MPNAPSQIIPIAAKSNATTSKITKVPPPSHKISTGAIVGVTVGIIALIIAAAIAAYYVFKYRSKKRKRRKDGSEGDEMSPFHKAEMDATSVGKAPFEDSPYGPKFGEEMEGSNPDLGLDKRKGSEMEGSNPDLAMAAKLKSEMEGDAGALRAEAPGSGGVLRAEAPGSEGVVRAEAEGSRGGWEMDGNQRTLRSELPVFAPVEMYAGDHGLYELPSPVSGSDRPSPISSPHSPDRQSGAAASWSRRQMGVPRPPRSGSDISSPDEESEGTRPSPRRSRPTPGSLSSPSRVSPQSQSRERQGSGGADVVGSGGGASRRTTPTYPSPLGDDSDPDRRWRRSPGGNRSPRGGLTSREPLLRRERGGEGNRGVGSASSADMPGGTATSPNEHVPRGGSAGSPGGFF